jgi:hypothetical protein
MQSLDKSKNAEGIARTGGHGRSQSSATTRGIRDVAERRRFPRGRGCRAFAPTFEVNGNALGERGFVERDIFEFRSG